MPPSEFCEWVALFLRCAVQGCPQPLGPDPHHVKSRGAGGRDRRNVLPLCRIHHAEWHSLGRGQFERLRTLTTDVDRVWEEWIAERQYRRRLVRER